MHAFKLLKNAGHTVSIPYTQLAIDVSTNRIPHIMLQVILSMHKANDGFFLSIQTPWCEEPIETDWENGLANWESLIQSHLLSWSLRFIPLNELIANYVTFDFYLIIHFILFFS